MKKGLKAIWPPTVTEIGPELAPVGTGTTIEVALQLLGVAAVPLNETVLAPRGNPKFIPVTVTDAPTCPAVGDRLLITGVFKTLKLVPLLGTPDTVTTTFPGVAPLGTGTTIETAFQLAGVADVPLNVTVLAPCMDPKFVPVIVTEAPTTPDGGDRLVILGVGSTVNETPLLTTPPTVTTTLPVVAPFGTGTVIVPALQLLGLAVVPLNVTVPVDPKFVPLMVIDVPIVAVPGERPVMFGVGMTVKGDPMLAFPPTVTTTLLVIAPVGTVATTEVVLQLVIVVAVVVPNFTVPVVPKFKPVIVTDAPTAADRGDKLLIFGKTVKADPLLSTPLA